MTTFLKISVVICTYNRADKLNRLLSHIASNVSLPIGAEFDFWVVDNNSKDHTKSVTESYMNKLQLNYLTEKQQGLSFARNCAIQATQADWLIFIDDDVLPEAQFFSEYLTAIQAKKADYLGGRILLNWLTAKPNWLQDENLPLIAGVLGKFDLGKGTCSFSESNESPRGANFAISRTMLNDLGGFDTRLGVIGDTPGRGEETEYFLRAQNQGYQGTYCGEAMCLHDALIERLTTHYLLIHGFEKGRAQYLMDATKNLKLSSEPILWLRALVQLVKGRRDRYLQTVINIGIRRGYFSESNS